MVERVKLKRELSLIHGVAIICGLVIGSGIYIAPKGVLMRTHSVGTSIIIWILGGILATIGALSFAELGTTFPSGGEKYHYLEKTYGPFVAFLYLWMYLFMFRPGANAIKCLVFAQYVLQPFFPDCEIPNSAIVLLALCLACVLTAVNCMNVRAAANGQSVMTSLGLIALVIICVSGIVYITGNRDNFIEPFSTSTKDIGDLFLACYSGIFAYWGWNALNFMVEELKDPYRNLPRAIYISMTLITLLYVTVNVSYMGVLGVQAVLTSQAVAVTFAQKMLGYMAWIMPVLIAINNAGSFNSGSLVGSRLCFVGARRGHLPAFLALINLRFFTPMTALLFQLVMITITMTSAGLYTIYNNLVFANAVFDALNVAGLIWNRYKMPDIPRPIKMPLVMHAIFLICMTFLAVFPLVLKPKETILGAAIIAATGIPYYILFIKWKSKPVWYSQWLEKQTTRIQKLFFSVREEEPDF